GWLASMLPAYMKHYYKDEALFVETKMVTSVYSQSFEGTLDQQMINKVEFDDIPADAVHMLEHPDYLNIINVAVLYSGRVIIASEAVSDSLKSFVESTGKPFLPYVPKEIFAEAYTNFYKNALS